MGAWIQKKRCKSKEYVNDLRVNWWKCEYNLLSLRIEADSDYL